jgi:hypothetical protein
MTKGYAKSLSFHSNPADSRFVKRRISAKRRSYAAVLAKLFILVIMANGIIANYAPLKDINAGTFCIDTFVLLLFACALIREPFVNNASGRSLIPDVQVFFLFTLIAVFTLLSIIAVGCYTPGLPTVLRIRFLYWLIVPSLFVLLEREDVDNVLRFFVDCGVVFCCFAIVQALFPDVLGSKLLYVEYDGVLGLNWSESTATLVLRSNALMGNSIEYGGVCVILFALALSNLLSNRATPLGIAKVAIIAAGCYFSYSRIACAGLVVAAAILYFRLYRKPSSSKFLTFFILVMTFGFAGYFVLGGSALMNRFFGNDAFTQASNAYHANSIGDALDVIADNAVFGTGLGTQTVSSSRVISDGWWFQLAAETGLVVLILYFFVYQRIAELAWQSQKSGVGTEELLAVVILVCLTYFILASLVNTSFVGRADCSLFMCLIGLYLASRGRSEGRTLDIGESFLDYR